MRIARVPRFFVVVFAIGVGLATVGGICGCGGAAASVTTPPINVQQAKAPGDYSKSKIDAKKFYRRR